LIGQIKKTAGDDGAGRPNGRRVAGKGLIFYRLISLQPMQHHGARFAGADAFPCPALLREIFVEERRQLAKMFLGLGRASGSPCRGKSSTGLIRF
jgi:hypothetical protein